VGHTYGFRKYLMGIKKKDRRITLLEEKSKGRRIS
jgi:hypothetical protein